jgi:hypothetical protein
VAKSSLGGKAFPYRADIIIVFGQISSKKMADGEAIYLCGAGRNNLVPHPQPPLQGWRGGFCHPFHILGEGAGGWGGLSLCQRVIEGGFAKPHA